MPCLPILEILTTEVLPTSSCYCTHTPVPHYELLTLPLWFLPVSLRTTLLILAFIVRRRTLIYLRLPHSELSKTADAMDGIDGVVFVAASIVPFMSMGTPLANLARTKTQSSDKGSAVEVMVHPFVEKQPVMSVHDAGALNREIEEARCNTSAREWISGPTKSKSDRGAIWFL